MRLDKYLCDCDAGTRSEVKKMIASGRVTVNGIPQKSPKLHVEEGSDRIELDGKQMVFQRLRYFLLHKPGGCVSAVTDNVHPTVMEYLKDENTKDCSPVGRLDLDTEGLLLITNDGKLSHNLLSPSRHVEKIYLARLDLDCPEGAEEAFEEGLDIGDEKPTLPAKLYRTEDPRMVRVSLCEGRFHQVKRMFEAIGCRVEYLKRESMGALKLGDLKPGQYRELTDSEVKMLQQAQ